MTSVQIRERLAKVKKELYFISQGGLTSPGQFDPGRAARLHKENAALEQQLEVALRQEQLVARLAVVGRVIAPAAGPVRAGKREAARGGASSSLTPARRERSGHSLCRAVGVLGRAEDGCRHVG
jgi:hypothetical protein